MKDKQEEGPFPGNKFFMIRHDAAKCPVYSANDKLTLTLDQYVDVLFNTFHYRYNPNVHLVNSFFLHSLFSSYILLCSFCLKENKQLEQTHFKHKGLICPPFMIMSSI